MLAIEELLKSKSLVLKGSISLAKEMMASSAVPLWESSKVKRLAVLVGVAIESVFVDKLFMLEVNVLGIVNKRDTVCL